MRPLAAAAALGLLVGPAMVHAAAGQVLFALGPVEIKRAGQTIVAARGTAVEVGDTVSTGPTGMTQMRMKDGSLLSLRYGSSLSIDEFRLPAAAPATPASGPSAATGGGRSVLRLLRGAFRTVTGLIGKNTGDSYSVVTPVATIGIRGTDYSAAYCSGDCGKTPDGLYVGVSNGAVEVNNSGGALVLSNDQYGYVKDPETPPNQELKPPEVLETPIAPEEGEGGADSESDGGASVDEGAPDASFAEEASTEGTVESGSDQPEGDYELLPGSPGMFAFARNGTKYSNNNGVYTDDSGALSGFLTDTFTSIGTAQNVNRGSNDETGLRWGRWTGGVASIGGSALDLNNSSLHWVYTDTAGTVLPVSGTLSYTLVGNTNPTDNHGNTGFIGSATFEADFTSGTALVNSTLNIGFGDSGTAGSQLWQASGSGTVQFGTVFQGTYGSVSIETVGGGTVSGSGAFAGFFTDGAAGVGLTYDLTDGVSTQVSGAAAFGDPQPVVVVAP